MSDAVAGAPPIQRPAERTRARSASTPARLRVLSTLIAAFGIGLTIVGAGGLLTAESQMIGIQQRTVPAILSMQRIHAWLADADRSAANAYLAGGSEVTLPEQQFQADIGDASRELQSASEHNPGGGDTSQRLQDIAALIDQYVELVQTASVLDRQDVATGTVYLQAGTVLMHRPGSGILAKVDALRAVYASSLDQATRTLDVAGSLVVVYGAGAIVLLVLLVRIQLFLRRRFHRRRNPRLLAATLLLLLLASATGLGTVQAATSIRQAQARTYARLLDLWDARALLYDANGNESLSLIAVGGGSAGAQFDQAFGAETHQLVDRPLTDDIVDDARNGRIRFDGLLADELRAAAAPDEHAAAITVLLAYQRFMDTDAAMRKKVGQGDATGAITIALGTDQGQLNFAFADVDWYLGVAIQHLQSEYDSTMQVAELVVGGTAAVQLAALAIAALVWWGVRPRLDEYRRGAQRPR